MKRLLAEISLESRLAIESAIAGDSRLTAKESEANISDNVVEVLGFNEKKELRSDGSEINVATGGTGSGLMITTDGWIITAYHNIKLFQDEFENLVKKAINLTPTEYNIHAFLEEVASKYAIIFQDRKLYPVNPFLWVGFPSLDIALIKAIVYFDINRKPEPIRFKVIHDELNYRDEIMLFGFRNERLCPQYGKVISTMENVSANVPDQVLNCVYDTFTTDAYCTLGFSGGAITTLNGELAGLVLYAAEKPCDSKGKLFGFTGGAKLRNIAKCVNAGISKLSQQGVK